MGPAPRPTGALIVAYNKWICRYAMCKGCSVADYYRALVDTATGCTLAAYDFGDQTHPSPEGTGAMASVLLAAMFRPLTSTLLLT